MTPDIADIGSGSDSSQFKLSSIVTTFFVGLLHVLGLGVSSIRLVYTQYVRVSTLAAAGSRLISNDSIRMRKPERDPGKASRRDSLFQHVQRDARFKKGADPITVIIYFVEFGVHACHHRGRN